MAVARKVGHVFILIQFFSYLRKQGWLFRLVALKRIHTWVHLNGLFDFCTPWNCQKIIDFLMVLVEGWSLNSFCIVLLFWWCSTGVTLVFRWYSGVLTNKGIFQNLFCNIKQKQFWRISSCQNQNMTWKQNIKVKTCWMGFNCLRAIEPLLGGSLLTA